MKKITVMILTCLMVLSLAACGGSSEPAETTASAADLGALYEACTAHMTPMKPVEGDMRQDFMGIDPEDCSQVYTAFAEDGLLTDELWLIEAVNQEALGRLHTLAENRMKAKADETVTYSPEQYAVVEKGVILEEGLYLALIVSPQVEAIQAEVEAALS